MGTVVLQHIQKSYDGKVACADINLCIKKGEFFTFLGPSGCGKTTILRLIAGFIGPDGGSIFLGDRDITGVAPEKRDVGMVFQNYALFPFMSVRENIEYGLKLQKHSKRDIKKKTERYVAMVGLEGFEDRGVSELSGGEQQRVAFARSLAIEPKVLLLDEPLSNLDARLRDNMRVELKLLQKKLGITTIFVTHDQVEALTLSDRIGVFNAGHCVQVGTPEDIYQQPETAFVAEFIGETNLFPVRVREGRLFLADTMALRINGACSGKYVSIRPQDIVLSKDRAECANSFYGNIEQEQFNGVFTDYSVRVEDLSFRVTVVNSINNQRSFRVGDPVFLGFSADTPHVLNG